MNPYRDQIVPDPETRPAVTVRSYNLDAVETLSQRILSGVAGRTNHTTASVLLSEDPGFGKTHLLTRVLDAVAPACLPVFIPPINAGPNLGRGVNHRVVSRLWRMVESGRSVNQFEWLALQLVARSCSEHSETAEAWRRFPLHRLDDADVQEHLGGMRSDLQRWLSGYLGTLQLQESALGWSSALLDILSADVFVEDRATEWIKGRLSHYPDLSAAAEGDPAEPPDESARAEVRLYDLLRLFAVARPVLFVFDQVENFAAFGEQSIQVLFNLIERILVESSGTQVVIAANAHNWHEFLDRSGLPPSMIDRFAEPILLRGLSMEEACELRDARAGSELLGKARELVPDELVRTKLDPGPTGQGRSAFGSPRRFLKFCAASWDGKPSEAESARVDFEREYERAKELARREGLGFFPDAVSTFLREVYGAELLRRDGYEFFRTGNRLYFLESGAHHKRWEALAQRALTVPGIRKITALRPARELSRLEHRAHSQVPGTNWNNVPSLDRLLSGAGKIREVSPDDMLEVIGACRFLDASADMGTTRRQSAAWLRGRRQGKWKPTGDGALEAVSDPNGAPGVVQVSVRRLVDLLQHAGGSLPSGEALPMRERGILFHELACRFVQQLIDSESVDTPVEDCLKRFLDQEQLWDAVKAFDSREPRLSDALTALAAHIERIRREAGVLSSWQELYVATELQVHQVLGVYENVTILLTGRCDVLRRQVRGGAPEIVDYKLSSVGGTAVEHQLQLALYARLLSQGANPMACRGTLELYSPQLAMVHFSHEELLGFFRKEIEPALRRMARQALEQNPAARQIALDMVLRGSGDADASDPGVDVSIEAEPEPVARVAESEPVMRFSSADPSRKIEEAFRSFRLEVAVIKRLEAPQVVRYLARPARGVKVTSLANRGEDLQVALGLKSRPLVFAGPGYVCIDVEKPSPDVVTWAEVLRRDELKSTASPVAFPVGLAVDGSLATADFSDGNMAHALVAGASGSGKSEFLKSLVASLISRNVPGTLSLSVIDPKILTFAALEGSPFLREPVISDVARAMRCLRDSIDEMDRRYRLLRNEGFENLTQRLAAGKRTIPYRVLVFDEFADLVLSSRDARREFEHRVALLAGKGRAAGIHLVLATQRPDREILTGLVKANLPLKLCFRVVNAANSQIVLGEAGAETLLGKGDLLADLGGGLIRAQAPYLTKEEFERVSRSGSVG